MKKMDVKEIGIVGFVSMLIAACLIVPAGAQPTPFIIFGFVCDSESNPVNNSDIEVTNLNTGEVYPAITSDSSNFYQIVLENSSEVKEGDTLRIMAKKMIDDGPYNPENYTYSVNVTDYEITMTELNSGGIFDFNLTLNHYCINYYPDYRYFTQDAWNYSGAAVLQMWTDFKGLSYTQDDLQEWGRANNTQADKDAGTPYIDPRGMAETLNKLPLSAHFTVGVHDNTSAGLSYAMHRVCWWQYLGPGALPTDGYYAKWMSVRGIHTDRNPHEGQYGGYGDWGYDVYGFWINDPNSSASSIGANSYKTAAEWTSTYYMEIIDPINNASPYNYNHKYITVLEPPEHAADVRIVPPKPRLTKAITPVLKAKTMKVDGIERLALVETVEDEDALDIVKAAIDGVTEELVPYDPAFAAVFAKTVSGEPMLVKNDAGKDYYLVPFNVPMEKGPIPLKKAVEIEDVDGGMIKLISAVDGKSVITSLPIEPIHIKEERTLVVVIVDAEGGSFKEASWVENPVKYLPVSKSEALKLALGEALDKLHIVARKDARDLEFITQKPTIELVYHDSSPYYPDWKVTINGKVFYVSQDGAVS